MNPMRRSRWEKVVDFHSHILPRMDDGSRNTQESLEMLRASAAQGIRVMAATPHFYAEENSVERFLERRETAWKALSEKMEAGMPKVLPGAEVYYFEGMQRTESLSRLKIEGTNLLLLEMPFAPWSDRMIAEIMEINRMPDTQVVLAHIERYLRFQKAAVWDSLLENGVLMQANASFFLHRFSKHKALHMVKKGRIHLLGSDCHNMDSRPPQLGAAMEILSARHLLQGIEDLGKNLIPEKEVCAQ